MLVFININSNISAPEVVSLLVYNIDNMYIDGMLLTRTQIILDFVIPVPFFVHLVKHSQIFYIYKKTNYCILAIC